MTETRESNYYLLDVDLTGSILGPDYRSMRAFVDGLGKTSDQLRVMVAEHYEIPVVQVGEPKRATDDDWGTWGASNE